MFEEWNIKRTRDFGEIVFNLVNNRLLRKTPDDAIEDFDEVYDFKAVFETEFEIDLETDLKV